MPNRFKTVFFRTISVLAIILTAGILVFGLSGEFQVQAAPGGGDGGGDTQCTDRVDNDSDGVENNADPGCGADNSEYPVNNDAICEDGVDNDSDTKIDMNDPSCDNNNDTYESPQNVCIDGRDNDNDGKVDSDDPACASNNSDDYREAPKNNGSTAAGDINLSNFIINEGNTVPAEVQTPFASSREKDVRNFNNFSNPALLPEGTRYDNDYRYTENNVFDDDCNVYGGGSTEEADDQATSSATYGFNQQLSTQTYVHLEMESAMNWPNDPNEHGIATTTVTLFNPNDEVVRKKTFSVGGGSDSTSDDSFPPVDKAIYDLSNDPEGDFVETEYYPVTINTKTTANVAYMKVKNKARSFDNTECGANNIDRDPDPDIWAGVEKMELWKSRASMCNLGKDSFDGQTSTAVNNVNDGVSASKSNTATYQFEPLLAYGSNISTTVKLDVSANSAAGSDAGPKRADATAKVRVQLKGPDGNTLYNSKKTETVSVASGKGEGKKNKTVTKTFQWTDINGDVRKIVAYTKAEGATEDPNGSFSSSAALQSVDVTSPSCGNESPTATDDGSDIAPVCANPSQPVTINVLANDSDPNNDNLEIKSVESPTNGTTAVITENGTDKIRYTPSSSSGIVTFNYTIKDGNGGTDTATVTITLSSCGKITVKVQNQNGNTVSGAEFTPKYDTNGDGSLETLPSKSGTTTYNVPISKDARLSKMNKSRIQIPSGKSWELIEKNVEQTRNGQAQPDGFWYGNNKNDKKSNLAKDNPNKCPNPQKDTFTVDPTNNNFSKSAPALLLNDTDPESDTITVVQPAAPDADELSIGSSGSFTFNPRASALNGGTTRVEYTYNVTDNKCGSEPSVKIIFEEAS